MSFNGSGTYTLPTNSFAQAVTGTTISSSGWNATGADLATALTTVICKDGQSTTTARIPFAQGASMGSATITAVAAGTATTHAANVGQLQNGGPSYLTSVAGTNTITATAAPVPAYAVGQRFTFTPANTNTGAATLNISSVGAGAVQWAGAALTGGELVAGTPVTVLVTATTPVFEIVAPTQFPDTRALVVGGTDATKKVRIEVDGITTSTTRVWTARDADFEIGAATQAEQEAGTSIVASVTPGRQQYHPSAVKAWAYVTNNGAATLVAGYNVSSVTWNSTGNVTVTLDTDMSSANYCAVATPTSVGFNAQTLNKAAGSLVVNVRNGANTQADDNFNVVVLGDQ